jgi:methylated-DNA-[protein]-cysteine S-methyltransferase
MDSQAASSQATGEAGQELTWGTLGSPVGEISVACSAAGVARVRFGPPPAIPGEPAHPEGRDQLERARTQLAEYFGGQRRAFGLPVDWSGSSGAQRQVLPVLLATVAYGETVTYGALADLAGLAAGGAVPAARVVGQVMGSNPCPIIVPCHRVVAGDGLGGYSGGAGVETKRWLLTFEGALPPTLDWDPAGPAGPAGPGTGWG